MLDTGEESVISCVATHVAEALGSQQKLFSGPGAVAVQANAMGEVGVDKGHPFDGRSPIRFVG